MLKGAEMQKKAHKTALKYEKLHKCAKTTSLEMKLYRIVEKSYRNRFGTFVEHCEAMHNTHKNKVSHTHTDIKKNEMRNKRE